MADSNKSNVSEKAARALESASKVTRTFNAVHCKEQGESSSTSGSRSEVHAETNGLNGHAKK
jgi:hypothetical protein